MRHTSLIRYVFRLENNLCVPARTIERGVQIKASVSRDRTVIGDPVAERIHCEIRDCVYRSTNRDGREDSPTLFRAIGEKYA